MNKHARFENLVHQAEADEGVLGLLVLGSRGKGFEHERSDYDVTLIVRDEYETAARRYEESAEMDVGIETLSSFLTSSAWGSPEAWDRYDFTHVLIPIDKTGTIARLAEKRGLMTKAEAQAFIRQRLDGYVNAVFRVVKCARDGSSSGVRLESAESIPCLLDVVFALEQRPKPFARYLELELKKYPLQKLPWGADEFLHDIMDILATGNVRLQQNMLRTIKTMFTKEGYADIFDAWEGKDEWAIEYAME